MADSGSAEVADLLSDVQGLALRASSPIVVHVVANGVRGDSRVIKSAQTSAEQGFTTLILGITVDDQPEALSIDGVSAVLVPYFPKHKSGMAERWHRRSGRITAFRRIRRARALLRRVSTPAPVGEPVQPWWATARPDYLNINVAFAAALDALGPAVIHVHDTAPLPAAIAHAYPRRLRGGSVRVLYDSHECVPELVRSFPENPTYAALLDIEQGYIRDADRVITVSRQIAKVLEKTYELRPRPAVVTNAPTSERDPSAPDLRTVIGLPDDVPLAVYSGWIAAERGLGTVIRALPSVPDLHLAVVCNPANRSVIDVVKQAQAFGVYDRVHLAGYVPPSQVTQYLSSATLGLIPRKSGGHLDLSLPTKYREFLHAGLPLVVSSNKTMAREVRETGVGEVFRAGNVGGLAYCLQRVLADTDRYRRAITPELLASHSWEEQATVLQGCYRGLSAKPPSRYGGPDLAGILRKRLGTRFAEGSAAVSRLNDQRFIGVALGIGRANSAGQAYQWAEAVSREFGFNASSFGPERAICHPPHRVAPTETQNPHRMATELGRILGAHTHVLIDGFECLAGTLLGDDIEPEICLLRRHGVQVGLIAHGSDVRDPAAHRERFVESYFHHVPSDWLELVGDRAARNREIARGFDGPVFVSTPDLLADLPGATWLPVAVDLAQWTSIPDLVERRLPRVLHRPSRSTPPIKGSEVIMPVLEDLHRRRIIDLVEDPGPVPAAAMPALVASADIVVDQIRMGSYGVAAVEAMASGRVVVGNVSADVRRAVATEIPVVDATPETLAEVLTTLASDWPALVERGAAGRTFAARWHSGKASAQVLVPFLAS